MNKRVIDLGNVMVTPGALGLVRGQDDRLIPLLLRHLTGDWGDLDEEDKQANEDAVMGGGRVLSAYKVGDEKVWVITEADRSATTILTPDEY